jgi:hypothetical protein
LANPPLEQFGSGAGLPDAAPAMPPFPFPETGEMRFDFGKEQAEACYRSNLIFA